MGFKTITHNKLTWVNIDQIDDDARKHLAERYAFHPLDLEDVEADQHTPKIDAYKEYLFIVLQFPQWDTTDRAIVAQEIDMFIGDNFLITIQKNKSKELKNFFYRCMNNDSLRNDWMSQNSGYLLYELVESLFHSTRPILNNLGKNISNLEQKIFSGNQQSGAILELGMHRRNVLTFRRILDPERQIISSLYNYQKPFLGPELHIYFEDITDYLNNLWSIVNTYKDTIDGIHVTVESLLKRRANKIITVLTVIQTVFTPPALYAAIYGMNVNLPYAQHPSVIWWSMGIITVFSIILMIILQRRRWL